MSTPLTLLCFDTMMGIHGGNQLDSLLLLNYGDVYEDLTEEGKRGFIKEDVALVRKFFNNAYQSTVEIGINLSRHEMSWLNLEFPRMTFVYKPRSNNLAKLVKYELWAMIMDNIAKSSGKQLTVCGCRDVIRPLNKLEHTDIKTADLIVLCDEIIDTDSWIAAQNKEKNCYSAELTQPQQSIHGYKSDKKHNLLYVRSFNTNR